MTKLLQQVIAEIEKLLAEQQDAIAARFLAHQMAAMVRQNVNKIN